MGFWGRLFQREGPAAALEPLVKHCECGTLIWDVEAAFQLPDYCSDLLCPNCGRDHSRTPSEAWVHEYGKRRMQRFIRLFGEKEARRRVKAGELSTSDYRIKRDRPSVGSGIVGDVLA